jgi:hypothetical protein
VVTDGQLELALPVVAQLLLAVDIASTISIVSTLTDGRTQRVYGAFLVIGEAAPRNL